MNKQATLEFNFDGLVGPTHNYSALAFGNIASGANGGAIANPKQAAKEGLLKMHTLMELGIPQAVLPPQQRPNLDLLRGLGFRGDTATLLQAAYKYQPELLSAVYSAASMWTANMATVSASCNTEDGKLHITPANLSYNLHRAQEAEFNYKVLTKIFADPQYFSINAALPSFRDLGDEGAANHSSLTKQYGNPGLEMFVYGKLGLDDCAQQPQKFPARQTKLASSSIMRQHLLAADRCLAVRQNPVAIDAGVFHNDVIWVANKNVAFYHAEAFFNWAEAKQDIKKYFADEFYFLEITSDHINLVTAVETYLFNSQLVSLPNGDDMALIVPMECKDSAQAKAVLDFVVAEHNPIKVVKYVNCLESMRNGGGPACLRLRIILTPQQQKSCHHGIILDQGLYNKLEVWIEHHYRDRLSAEDFLDPALSEEVFVALDELTNLLGLGSIYPFQN